MESIIFVLGKSKTVERSVPIIRLTERSECLKDLRWFFYGHFVINMYQQFYEFLLMNSIFYYFYHFSTKFYF